MPNLSIEQINRRAEMLASALVAANQETEDFDEQQDVMDLWEDVDELGRYILAERLPAEGLNDAAIAATAIAILMKSATDLTGLDSHAMPYAVQKARDVASLMMLRAAVRRLTAAAAGH